MKKTTNALLNVSEAEVFHRLAEERLNLFVPGSCYHHAMPQTFDGLRRIVQHILPRNTIKTMMMRRIVIIQTMMMRRIVIIQCKKAIQCNHPVCIRVQTLQKITPLPIKPHFKDRAYIRLLGG